MCEPLHSGIQDCVLHQPSWPIVPSWSKHRHCNQLLQMVNDRLSRKGKGKGTSKGPVKTPSTTTTEDTSTPTTSVMMTETTANSFPKTSTVSTVITTHTTACPERTETKKMISQSPSTVEVKPSVIYVTNSWSYIHSLCTIVGVILGVIGHIAYGRHAHYLQRFGHSLRQLRKKNILGDRSSGAFAYVSTVPSTRTIVNYSQTTSLLPSYDPPVMGLMSSRI